MTVIDITGELSSRAMTEAAEGITVALDRLRLFDATSVLAFMLGEMIADSVPSEEGQRAYLEKMFTLAVDAATFRKMW